MAKMTYGEALTLIQKLNELQPTTRGFELLLVKNVQVLEAVFKHFESILDQDKYAKVKAHDEKNNAIRVEMDEMIKKTVGLIKGKPSPKQDKMVDKIQKSFQKKSDRHYEENKEDIKDFVVHRDIMKLKETTVDLVKIDEGMFPAGLDDVQWKTFKPLIK